MRTTICRAAGAMILAWCASAAVAQNAVNITIDPSKTIGHLTPHLTGACIEDVNHEIYGGLYSQMIYGESFQESVPGPIVGFTALGGKWTVNENELHAEASDGAKLVHNAKTTAPVRYTTELFFPDDHEGNAGVIFGVTRAGVGADRFNGYEVSIDPGRKILRLARHRQNYRLIQEVPCDVAPQQWIDLAIARDKRSITIVVNKKDLIQYDADEDIAADFGFRTWHRPAVFRNTAISDGAVSSPVALKVDETGNVSGMWTMFEHGSAKGKTSLETKQPFVGAQSQSITFESGQGEIGLENRGLNHQGMRFIEGHDYIGHLWILARGEKPTIATVALAASGDAATVATSDLFVGGDEWCRYEFKLTPTATVDNGQFQISLKSPGSMTIGYVYLSPDSWGTYKGLPVRADVVRGILDQGIRAMRYGGSMVNAPEYRWKKMIGDRDRRPPYHGHWYEHSSNGWGIIDFLSLCEAAGILPVPDININETPQDMLDFVEYVNGPADRPWGSKRAADGHPAPFNLTHIELGNEERVDDAYYAKFEAIARGIWRKDPKMVLTIGDFGYNQPITDPMHITGADSRITSLAAQQKILKLAKEFDAEVWFDIHIWTEAPPLTRSGVAWPTYVDAIDKLADGAKHQVVIFELNANNHEQRRALANASALIAIERDGRLPFVSSANGLQVDHQNDNGWDQGLLFMNPATTWIQPPGYVWQMICGNFQPNMIQCEIAGADKSLQAVATASDDKKTIVLQLLNPGDAPTMAEVKIAGSAGTSVTARTLAADLRDANTADQPTAVKPTDLTVSTNGGAAHVTLPAHSFTVVSWK